MVYNIHEDLVTLPQKLQIQQLPKPPEKKKKHEFNNMGQHYK